MAVAGGVGLTFVPHPLPCGPRIAGQGPGGCSERGPSGLGYALPPSLWPEKMALSQGQRQRRQPPLPLQSPAVGRLPKLPPAPPLLLPGQVAALWSPGPNFLLPASSHLWEAPLGCPANFQRLLPQEAFSVLPTPRSPTPTWNTPAPLPSAPHIENHLDHQPIFHLVPG